MSCESFRDDLVLLLDCDVASGDVESDDVASDSERSAAVRAHAQGCSSCQDELIRLTLALSELAELPVLVPSACAPARAEPLPARPSSAGCFRRSARAAALAGTLSRWQEQAEREEPEPTRLGEFEILAVLGHGGQGVVYHARDASGQEVALKVFLVSLSARQKLRLQRESQAVSAALRAAGDERLVGAFRVEPLSAEDPESEWIQVQPLLRGPTLEDLLERGRCTPEEATEITVELARALRAAHRAGLLVRNLRPSEVFLEEEGLRLVLSAQAAFERDTALTGCGVALGTPFYLSPEQLRGLPADPRSDLFALGAIYHELLTGAPPNKGVQTAHELIVARIEGQLPEPKAHELSPGHLRVLARLLAADASRRYAHAEEALRELVHLSEGLSLTGASPPWDQVVRLKPPLSTKTKVGAIALLGLVTALAALIALAFGLFS